MVIYITETTPIGAKRRILATESYAYFNQPTIRQQLSQNLLVDQILLKVSSSVDKMKEYLAVPQGGTEKNRLNLHITHKKYKRIILSDTTEIFG